MSSNFISQYASLSDDLSKPYTDSQDGGKKTKRSKKTMKKKSSSSTGKKKRVLKKKTAKRPVKKEMDKYKKSQLERIARKNKVSLRRRDGTPKTKSQLFRSLKRKKLV